MIDTPPLNISINGDLIAEILLECRRAHAKHGDIPDANDPARLAILVEEVGEVAKVLNDAHVVPHGSYAEELRAELVQVAAMAYAWADKIDAEVAE